MMDKLSPDVQMKIFEYLIEQVTDDLEKLELAKKMLD